MMLRHFDESLIEKQSSLLAPPPVFSKHGLEQGLNRLTDKGTQKKAVDAINAKF